MDRISRAGLTALCAFALALVSGYAGAVAIPQGPDNPNLHASQGVDLSSRAAKWEFQQAADQLQARGGFGVKGKGMGFAGNMVRNIGRRELIAGALGASWLLGGWGGAAALLAPIVWDAAKQAWLVPAVAGPGEIDSLAPSNASGYSGPYFTPSVWCEDHPSQGPLGSNVWQFVIVSDGSPGSGWGYWTNCRYRGSDLTQHGMWTLNVARTSSLAQCLGGVQAVLVVASGTCKDAGSGRPATEQELSDAMGNGFNRNPPAAAGLADWMHSNGIPFEAGDPYTEGPAHIDGPTETETSTSDAGTSTTQTQRAWDMTYQGRDVFVKEKETTTVTDEAGNTTTHETTRETTGGDAVPDDGSGDKPKAPDVCADHPDASGCAPLGSVDDDPDLDREDPPVTFGYTSVTASCPAPKTVVFMGQSFSFAYDGPCQFAQGIRPVVIAVALLGALVLVVRVGRG